MFLTEPPPTPGRDAAYQEDLDAQGYVDNLTRAWGWRPDVLTSFTAVRTQLQQSWSLSDLDRAVLVVATARARQDSYCSLAWGRTLAGVAGDVLAGSVLTGRFDVLQPRQQALARWATAVVQDPNSTTPDDVMQLREHGLTDQAIFEATAFIAFRLAFATVNDALGAEPDAQLADTVPEPVRTAVTYGRPPATAPSS